MFRTMNKETFKVLSIQEKLKEIIGKKVKRLFLVIWPPYGEETTSQIDISAGYIFEEAPDKLLLITTDMDDLTTPMVKELPVPAQYFEWTAFESRMKRWMDCEEGMEMDTEYYEVSDVALFKGIVNQKVKAVELVYASTDAPIGIKLLFPNDFVLSTPIADGNTIETQYFHQNQNLKYFKHWGAIEYISLKE